MVTYRSTLENRLLATLLATSLSCDSGSISITGTIDTGATYDTAPYDTAHSGDDTAMQYTWFRDADSDGYGTTLDSMLAVSQPRGYVLNDQDCDDADAAINPSAREYCDGVDNNCDGYLDPSNAEDAITWYADTDTDGYGDSYSETITSCVHPNGYASASGDCDDINPYINPGMLEYCNGYDDNCNSLVDDEDEGVADATTWYADADNDGYGNPARETIACTAPSENWVADDNTDCNDLSSLVNPAASEACDGVDNNCNGTIDDSCS